MNPWNPERTAGGSSGGEAAAISAGLSPLGLGSDLGGSIRIPASHCGVVGLKPTHGRVPLTGHWPDAILRFMHVGPMARSVADVALGLSAIAGPDPLDWWSVPAPAPPAEVGADVRGLRVGVLARSGFGPVAPSVGERRGGGRRRAGGRRGVVQPLELPWLEARDCNRLTMTLYGARGLGPASARSSPAARRSCIPSSAGAFRSRATPARSTWPPRRRSRGSDATSPSSSPSIDVLVCPSSPVTAHEHDLAELVLDGHTDGARAVMRATIPWNLTGSPALSVPFALDDAGLPIGVQVVGRRFDEETVLRVGAALERLAAGARVPPAPVGRGIRPYGRSNTAAMPWPPPMHMVTTPCDRRGARAHA